MRFDTIWLDARLATLAPGRARARASWSAARSPPRTAGSRSRVRRRSCRPAGMRARASASTAAGSRPGLIDCHTHLVYARRPRARIRAAARRRQLRGDRAGRRRHRLDREGDARRRARTNSSPRALPRLDALIAEGVTTVEIKSGYGLDRRRPRRACCAPRARLGARARRSTWSRAFSARTRCRRRPTATRSATSTRSARMIPAHRARRARRRGRRLLRRHRVLARADRARVRRRQGRRACRSSCTPTSSPTCTARALAAEHGALSADHLEYTDEDGVAAMARAGTVAVLLPGAFYVLRETQAPPVDAFRRHSVPIAVATDCNPGTSPMTSLLSTMNMAATLFRLTVEECHRRRHARGGARARPARRHRHARAGKCAATSRSGISSGRPNWSTASASIRCMRGCWRGR